MPGPELSIFERLRGNGRTHDIELPAEGRPKDPRIPPSPGEQLSKAFKTAKEIQSKAALDGLYSAAGIKK